MQNVMWQMEQVVVIAGKITAGTAYATLQLPLNRALCFRRVHMINIKDNPIEWAQLGYELEEVREHLGSLSHYLERKGEIEEEEFMVQIFHAITHLNRIWNSRNHIGKLSEQDFENYSNIPVEFEPIG